MCFKTIKTSNIYIIKIDNIYIVGNLSLQKVFIRRPGHGFRVSWISKGKKRFAFLEERNMLDCYYSCVYEANWRH